MKYLHDKNVQGLEEVIKSEYANISADVKKDNAQMQTLEKAFNDVKYIREERQGKNGRTVRVPVDNYTVLDADAEEKAEIIRDLGRRDKNCVVPKEEREERRKLRDDFSRKFRDAALRREIVTAKYSGEDRTIRSLFSHELSSAARIENDRFVRIMKNGTPEEKKRELSRKLEQIGEMDLSFVDLTDDENFIRNYEKYCKIKGLGNLRDIADLAKKNGVDLKEPRFAKFCAKSYLLDELCPAVENKEKILSNPAYDVVDLEKLSPEHCAEISNETKYAKSFTGAAAACSALRGEAVSGSRRALFDASMTPAGRLQRSAELSDAGNTLYRENGAYTGTYPLFESDADRYFAEMKENIRERVCSGGVSGRKHVYEHILAAVVAQRMRNEYEQLAVAGTAPEGEELYTRFNLEKIYTEARLMKFDPDIKTAVAAIGEKEYELIACGDKDGIMQFDAAFTAAAAAERNKRENSREYYRKKILDNVKKIKKVDNSFSFDENDAAGMVSDKRLQRHEIAANILQNMERKKIRIVELSGAHMNETFQRIVPYLGKRDGEPDADAYNRELFGKLNGTTPECEEFRRKTLTDILNGMNNLSIEAFRPKEIQIDPSEKLTEEQIAQRKAEAYEDQIFEYAARNFETAYLAFDVKKTFIDNLASSGFKLSEEAQNKLSEQYVYLTDLATPLINIIKKYGEDSRFTIPLDKLNEPLANDIMKKGVDSFKDVANYYFEDDSDKKNVAQMLTSASLSGKTYSENDFISTAPADEKCIPDCTSLRATYAKFYRELKDADNFYNTRNSEEYKNVLTALENADRILGGIDGVVPTDKKQSLLDAIESVSVTAKAYSTKKKNEEVSKNRTKRIAICERISRFNKNITYEDETNNPHHHYALDVAFMKFLGTNRESTAIKEREQAEEYRRTRTAPVNEKIRRREALFESGLRKTEAERSKIDTLKDGTNARKAQVRSVDARDDLTNLVGRKDIDRNKARSLIATVLYCDKIAEGDKNAKGMTKGDMIRGIMALAENREFLRVTKKIDSDFINRFLSENGSREFGERLGVVIDPAAARNEPEEISGPALK